MFLFPIEAGHILTFCRSIGDDHPVYHDLGTARSAGFAGILAPPTFVEASAHFDPASQVRPLPGAVWFGSASSPTGDPDREARSTGSTFHAETHFEYHRDIVAGQVLHVTERPGRTWTRHGARGGRLGFRDWYLDHVDDQGRPVVTVRTVAVSTEEKVPAPSGPPPAGRTGGPSPEIPEDPAPGPVDMGHVEVGDSRSMRLVHDLTRTRIIQYAGASGDFSPQHTDEFYNTNAAGYPTVFAHGMLSMGMTARLLTRWFGPSTLSRYGMRFLQPVWPGATLTAHATVTAVDRLGDGEARAEVAVETRDQHGSPVLRGTASVRLLPAGSPALAPGLTGP